MPLFSVRIAANISPKANPIVTTASGPVQGFTKTTGQNHQRLSWSSLHIYSMTVALTIFRCMFRQIPFAEPPIGDLRFKKPVPSDPWTEIFDATKLPNACHQEVELAYGPEFPGEAIWIPNTPLSEDCLYLNLWVPEGAKMQRQSSGSTEAVSILEVRH